MPNVVCCATQTHERADVEKVHGELVAAKAALATAIAEAQEREHKVGIPALLKQFCASTHRSTMFSTQQRLLITCTGHTDSVTTPSGLHSPFVASAVFVNETHAVLSLLHSTEPQSAISDLTSCIIFKCMCEALYSSLAHSIPVTL